jgi:RNA polymerase sigma-70 factor (ECF subfamily)
MNDPLVPLDDVPLATSLSLLERVKARDPEAWRRLVRLYGPLVYRWCQRWALAQEDVADIFQEVFQAVSGQIAVFHRDRPNDSFRGWFWTITRHKIMDHFRSQGKQPRATGGSDAAQRLLDLPEQLPEEDDEADESGIVHRVLEMIRGDFAPHTWQAFWQLTIEGQTSGEVAADLGITPEAARMAKSRVLGRLRQELAGLAEGPFG